MLGNIGVSFTSLEDFKAKAEFYPKGRIIPQRILKTTSKPKGTAHKLRHRIKFGSNFYLIRFHNRNLLFSFDDCVIAIEIGVGVKDAYIYGNPYGEGGSHWIGVNGWDDFCSKLSSLLSEFKEADYDQ
ncbi:hypothetical protein [Paenalcaligenes suwonensis]|uniref:hypothetical protein n=1 Tax=Paenalcaligenes suwonensis TaxID=1202713 RepID=UPI00140BE8F9|nr:hypothetical protein [Paenalcaligenes suwonensis]NHC63200.1 hypothetical protein [Paenalcaligenes suwonensis]